MSAEALEATLVQRHDLVNRLIDLIKESVNTDAKQHSLLVGPRGIGKTHVVSIIHSRLAADASLASRLSVAWLREEEWGIASFLDLILRILRSLLSPEESQTTFNDIAAARQRSQSSAEKMAIKRLEQQVDGRTLLVIVENLHEVFRGLGDRGQKQLRAYIQEKPFISLLATTPSLFAGVSIQQSPFYGFFRVVPLEELNLREATDLLTRIATLSGDTSLRDFLSTPTGRARVRAIHHLAGGNPRVYVLFAQFLTRESLDTLVEPFMRTLDDLTPYYQARMSELSSQQQKIIEILCDAGKAMTVRAIATATFATHQTTSGQLKLLRERGYARSVTIGRESFYELREPLMRLTLSVKKHRGQPVRLLIDFLRLWYSRRELEVYLRQLSDTKDTDRAYLSVALSELVSDGRDQHAEACQADCAAFSQNHDWPAALEAAEELVAVRGNAADWSSLSHALIHVGSWVKAAEAATRAIALEPTTVEARSDLAIALNNQERHEDALKAVDEWLNIADSEIAHELRAMILANLKRLDDAFAEFEGHFAIRKVWVQTLPIYVSLLSERGQKERARDLLVTFATAFPDENLVQLIALWNLFQLGFYAEAGELGRSSDAKGEALEIRGLIAAELEHYDDAIRLLTSALAAGTSERRWALCANLSRVYEDTGDFVSSHRYLDEAIALKPEEHTLRIRRGNLFLSSDELPHSEGVAKAIAEYEVAVAIAPSNPHAKLHLGLAHVIGKHWQEAIPYLTEARNGGENVPILSCGLVEAYVGIDNLESALAELKLLATRESADPGLLDFESILLQLFEADLGPERLSRYSAGLLQAASTPAAVDKLGRGIVAVAKSAGARFVSPKAAQWIGVWATTGSEVEGLALPIRVVQTVLAYRDSGDPRLLLELPMEQRQLAIDELLADHREMLAPLLEGNRT